MALLIMCVAVLSPVIYIYYNWLIWRYTDMATSYLVRFIITQFGIETVAQFNWQSVVLASKTFRIHIYSPCSGVEGIAFTFYMISVFLLADWRFFSRCPYILEFYLVGFLFVFAVNATRIASIFLYGHWVHLYSIEDIDGRRKMVDIFHSNAGWLLYSIAISLFIMGMYALAARTSKAAKPEG
jgi:exosortase/archaeosortase family protein